MFSPNTGASAETDNTIVISTVVHLVDHASPVLEPLNGAQQAAILANVISSNVAELNNFLHADPHDVLAIHSDGSMYVVETLADDHAAIAHGNAPLELVGVQGIVTTIDAWTSR